MKVSTLLESAERSQFYGRIELEYRAGHLTLIRKNESILPEPEGSDSRDERGTSCHRDEAKNTRRA